jgi:hypothetical protein
VNRKLIRVLPALLLAAGLLLTQDRVAQASTVNLLNIFQLEGDAQACNEGTSPTVDDWDSALVHAGFTDLTAPSCTTSGITSRAVAAQFLNDAITTETDSFTGGGTKDINDIGSWLWVPGSVQAKDNLTQVGSAIYSVPVDANPADNHEVLNFMSTRLAQNGAANQSFWFFQSQVSQKYNTDTTCTISSGCGFNGSHTFGDLLIQIGWSTGGTVGSVSVFEWTGGLTPPSGCSVVTTNLCQVFPTSATTPPPICGTGSGQSTGPICAIANNATDQPTPIGSCVTKPAQPAGSIPSPWAYTPKSGVANCIPPSGFMEAGIDLTAFGLGQKCFSTFDGETRSSPSVDSTLSDFEMASFPLCSAKMTIDSGNTNEVGVPHTFTLTAYQTIAGATTPAAGATLSASIDAKSTATPAAIYAGSSTGGANCTTGLGSSPPHTVSNLTTNSSGQAQVTVLACSAGQVLVDGSGTVNINGSPFTVTATPGTNNAPDCTTAAQCGVKTYVDARITLSPNSSNSVGTPHQFTATVYQNLGLGGGFVTAANEPVTITVPTGGDTTGQAALSAAAPTACPTATNYTLSGTTNGSGAFTFYVDSCAAGTVTVNASTTFSITSNGSTSALITRTTGDNLSGDTANAVKTYKSGSITVTKTVDVGFFTPLPNICFTLTRTDSSQLIVGGAQVTNGNQICHQYVSGDVTTQPSGTTLGQASFKFKWSGLASGSYSIAETTLTPSPPYVGISSALTTTLNVLGTGSQVDATLTANNTLPPGQLQIQKNVNGVLWNGSSQFSFSIYSCGSESSCNSVVSALGSNTPPTAVAGVTIPSAGNPATVANLTEGYYLIHENTAPAGFQIDSTTQNQVATVCAANSTNVGGPCATVPAQGFKYTFNNKQLYQLHVYVCDMAGNLHSNASTTVTLSGPSNLGSSTATQTTLGSVPTTFPAGTTSGDLCATNMTADYDNLLPTTAQSGTPYSASVTITP